jgi:hypothetical protein
MAFWQHALTRWAAYTTRVSFIVSIISITIEEISLGKRLRDNQRPNTAELCLKMAPKPLIKQLITEFADKMSEIGGQSLTCQMRNAVVRLVHVRLQQYVASIGELVGRSKNCIHPVDRGVNFNGDTRIV